MPAVRPLPTPPPSLAERIAAFRAEIDAVIDQMATDAAEPGVPWQVVRNLITRNSACQCRGYLMAKGELK